MKNMTKTQLQAEIVRLQGIVSTPVQAQVVAVATEKEEKDYGLKFLDMRKEFVIEIKDDRDGAIVAQVKFTSIVKWNKETRGIVDGSWLRIDVEKPRGTDKEMKMVYGLLSSKNKKGFVYLAETKMETEEAKRVVASC